MDVLCILFLRKGRSGCGTFTCERMLFDEPKDYRRRVLCDDGGCVWEVELCDKSCSFPSLTPVVILLQP